MRLVAGMFVVLSLGAGVAGGATEYLYRLDGVEDVSVHVEGAVAIVDIPSIAVAPRRLEQAGFGFRPQRLIDDLTLQAASPWSTSRARRCTRRRASNWR